MLYAAHTTELMKRHYHTFPPRDRRCWNQALELAHHYHRRVVTVVAVVIMERQLALVKDAHTLMCVTSVVFVASIIGLRLGDSREHASVLRFFFAVRTGQNSSWGIKKMVRFSIEQPNVTANDT